MKSLFVFIIFVAIVIIFNLSPFHLMAFYITRCSSFFHYHQQQVASYAIHNVLRIAYCVLRMITCVA